MYEFHPYYKPITTNVFDIPQRLKEIDPTLFVLWNGERERFEVHCSENKGNTLVMVVPFNELDSRTIDHIKKNMQMRNEGLLRIIDENNRKVEERLERERKNWIQDVVKETRWHFQKDKETLGL